MPAKSYTVFFSSPLVVAEVLFSVVAIVDKDLEGILRMKMEMVLGLCIPIENGLK